MERSILQAAKLKEKEPSKTVDIGYEATGFKTCLCCIQELLWPGISLIYPTPSSILKWP